MRFYFVLTKRDGSETSQHVSKISNHPQEQHTQLCAVEGISFVQTRIYTFSDKLLLDVFCAAGDTETCCTCSQKSAKIFETRKVCEFLLPGQDVRAPGSTAPCNNATALAGHCFLQKLQIACFSWVCFLSLARSPCNRIKSI